uniref:Uncharacterized protein n=1 Tax=Arundo donax TaxID=35708 RepID=A0A0A8Y8M4_ARUDO
MPFRSSPLLKVTVYSRCLVSFMKNGQTYPWLILLFDICLPPTHPSLSQH